MPWPIDRDTELFAVIDREVERQNTGLQLIASENFTSPAVMEAVGSVLTNKYSEGYPGKRYYGGNEFVDQAEDLAIDRVKALFGAEAANVQPHSGANANLGRVPGPARGRRHRPGAEPRPRRSPDPRVTGQHLGPLLQLRLLQAHTKRRATRPGPAPGPGTRTPPQDDRRGRHCVSPHHRSRADPTDLRRGRSAVPVRRRPHRRAHRRWRPPQPGPLRGCGHVHHAQDPARPPGRVHPVPRGACEGQINKAIFPGLQGGPLEHVIAGKAVAFREAATPEFRDYAHQIVANARRWPTASGGPGSAWCPVAPTTT